MEGKPQSIGMATMKQNGTIVLQLRAEDGGGTAVGDVLIEYAPTHPDYQSIVSHLGGIELGQSKPVRPWPDH